MEFTDKTVLGMLDVWRSGQTLLPHVLRWKYLINAPYNKGRDFRPQNDLQHAYSIGVSGRIMISRLSSHVSLDVGLLMTTLLVHDHGEGELKRDIEYVNNNGNHALDEYRTFVKRYQQLDGQVFYDFHEAFLLQRVDEDNEGWPEEALEIIELLAAAKTYEALAFKAIERVDYFLYALEQWTQFGNPTFLVRIIRNHTHEFEDFADRLPGFAEEFWTPELAAWTDAFQRSFEGKFDEVK